MSERPFLFLDVPEKYVEEPIKPSVGVSVVVPVYKEFDNGNIFRLIQTFSNQTADSNRFELLCVVNNPQKDADEQSQAFFENQKVLELEKYIKPGSVIPESYTPYQREIIQKAQEYGLAFHAIDVTGGGVERNMGRARQVGVIEAEKRLNNTDKKDEGIIAHMDADTVVEKKYIEKLIEFFDTTGVESTALHYDYVMPEGDIRLFQTSQDYDRRNWYYRLSGLLAGIPTVSTPQIAATVSAHKKIGGVPLRPVGEDVTLFDFLRNKTKFSSAPYITVFASDRARVESFDGSGRYHSLGNLKDAVCPNPSVDLVRKAIALRKYTVPGEIPDFDFIADTFKKFALLADQDALRNLYDQQYASSDSFFRALDDFIRSGQGNIDFKPNLEPVEYADKLIAIFTNWSNPHELHLLTKLLTREQRTQRIRHSFRQNIVKTVLAAAVESGDVEKAVSKNPEQIEFLAQNTWMKELLEDMLSKGLDNNQIYAELSDIFPGFLGEWKEELHGCTAKLKGLINFVMKSKHSREEYPGVFKAVNYFSSPLVL